jgi:hypothetical protein
MSYKTIDEVLRNWAARHALQLYTRYQESDVRTVFLEGLGRERGQIWIDPPGMGGRVDVHAAVYRERGRENEKAELLASMADLESVLEQAYSMVVVWLKGSK